MPILNKGYTKHADWREQNKHWDWGGYMSADLISVDIRVDIPASCDSMTATIVDWNFNQTGGTSGDGFVDFLGFAWWDIKDHTNFEDTFFVDQPRSQYYNGKYVEPSSNVFTQINSITMNQGSGFFDLDTFYWTWQGNEGLGRRGNSGNPVGKSHTWPLYESDFDDNGTLKDRIVFIAYQRHLDWGAADTSAGHRPSPEHAHWLITDHYWTSADIWNWKFHPMAIRKGSSWYSCNRLNSEVGHGDGHLGIRKGGRWNGVWNDDYDVKSSEGYYDGDPKNQAGSYVYLPRVGIGSDALRHKNDIHEWEP